MKVTREVCADLRAQGFEVSPSYVDFLTREGHLPEPAKFNGVRVWDRDHIEFLESALRRRGRWHPTKAQADAGDGEGR